MKPLTRKEGEELNRVLSRILNNLIVKIGEQIEEIDTGKLFTVKDIQIIASRSSNGLRYSYTYSISEKGEYGDYRYIKPLKLLKKFKTVNRK